MPDSRNASRGVCFFSFNKAETGEASLLKCAHAACRAGAVMCACAHAVCMQQKARQVVWCARRGDTGEASDGGKGGQACHTEGQAV